MQRGERLKARLLSRVGVRRASLVMRRGADLEGMAEEAEAATQSAPATGGVVQRSRGRTRPGVLGEERGGPVAGAEWGWGRSGRARGALGFYH